MLMDISHYTKVVVIMKCESCLTEMKCTAEYGYGGVMKEYKCPSGCMTLVKTDVWTATAYHTEVDDDGFYTIYESGARG